MVCAGNYLIIIGFVIGNPKLELVNDNNEIFILYILNLDFRFTEV